MVKYIVHNDDSIGSDVDEIIVGDINKGANIIDFDTIKYKKYISTVDVRVDGVSMTCCRYQSYTRLKVIRIYDFYGVCNHVFGKLEHRRRFKYHIYVANRNDTTIEHFIHTPHLYMLDLDVYKKHVDNYPAFCSKALKEYEKEYFDKTGFLSFADYDSEFIYNR